MRDLRQQGGLTVKQAAQLMEWSEPKLWRIETGQTTLRALDVQAMCAAYGAEPGLTQALVGLATQTRADGWWRAYGGTIPDNFGIHAVLEDAACVLASFAPFQVPGLLHTEAYARTLITCTGLGSEEADRLVYECLARRVLLTRAHSPLMMTVALDEALVHRPVGGPAVLAGQLRFLADMAALPNICLRVVPTPQDNIPGWPQARSPCCTSHPANAAATTRTSLMPGD